jgi:hypothetical protein
MISLFAEQLVATMPGTSTPSLKPRPAYLHQLHDNKSQNPAIPKSAIHYSFSAYTTMFTPNFVLSSAKKRLFLKS